MITHNTEIKLFAGSSNKALAEAIGIDSGVVAKATRLTLLSPTIVHKLILGEADLSMQTLRRSFPLVWEKQERELLR